MLLIKPFKLSNSLIIDLLTFLDFGQSEIINGESSSDFILDQIYSVIKGIKGCITVIHFLKKLIV